MAKLRLGRWEFALPRSRWVRIAIGILLILCGLLGFLPVLGFWMIPLGLIVLSADSPWIRRFRRRSEVWWHRRVQPRIDAVMQRSKDRRSE